MSSFHFAQFCFSHRQQSRPRGVRTVNGECDISNLNHSCTQGTNYTSFLLPRFHLPFYVPPSLPFSLPPSPFLQIPIDNKVEITFHYKQCFSLVKRIDGTLPCLCCLFPFNRITPSPFYLFPLLFFLLCPLSFHSISLFTHSHSPAICKQRARGNLSLSGSVQTCGRQVRFLEC